MALLGIERALTLGRRALSFASSIALFAIMLGVSLDAVLRYAFGWPVAGMLEGVELLLVFAVFANLAQTEADDGNIAINALTRHLEGRALSVVRIITRILALGLFLAMTVATARLAWRSWTMGEFSAGLVAVPIYPSRFIVSFGCLFLCLQLLVALVHEVKRLIHPEANQA